MTNVNPCDCDDCREDIRIKWRFNETLQKGIQGFFTFSDVIATITIDPRQEEREIAATMIHEMLEILQRLHNIPLPHDNLDTLSYPIADFILEHGFDVNKVMEGADAKPDGLTSQQVESRDKQDSGHL